MVAGGEVTIARNQQTGWHLLYVAMSDLKFDIHYHDAV
jgi:hypothetical protein